MTGYGGLDGIRFETVPLKRVLKSNDGGAWGADSEAPGTTPVAVLRSTDQSADGNWALESPAIRFLTAGEARATRLIEGDLVVTKSSGSERHIGKTTIVDSGVASLSPGFSNFMQRLRPNPRVTFPRFAWYFLNSQVAREQMVLASSTSTGLANLNAQVIGDLLIPLPSLGEQRRIAPFLDHETARIDELVREQERLAIQSKERFSAQMTAALTLGVRASPDVRTTDVPWIPQMKSDWQLVPFKRLVVLRRGFDLPQQDRASGSVPVVSSGGVIDRHDVAAVRGPGIVTGRYGTIGAVAYVDEDYWPLNTALYSREFHGNSVRFAFHVLRWLKPQVESLSAKSAVSGVDRNDLHQLLIALPPLEEQVEIAAFLDESLVELEKLTRSLQDLVAQLMERRSALISAAVTGQLDLRNWQPPELEAVAEVA